jgi:hypothetical protein
MLLVVTAETVVVFQGDKYQIKLCLQAEYYMEKQLSRIPGGVS